MPRVSPRPTSRPVASPGASPVVAVAGRIDTATLLRIAGAWVAANLSADFGSRMRCLEIDLRKQEVRAVTSPEEDGGGVVEGEAEPAARHPLDFEYTPTQAEILLALRRGDLRSDALAAAVRVDKARLFERGRGIDQLTAAGLVSHRERQGYYLTELGERLAELIAASREMPAK